MSSPRAALTAEGRASMTAATRKGMLDLTPNAITVLERRYLVKDDHGAPVEGPEDLFWRQVLPARPPPPEPKGFGPPGGAPAASCSLSRPARPVLLETPLPS